MRGARAAAFAFVLSLAAAARGAGAPADSAATAPATAADPVERHCGELAAALERLAAEHRAAAAADSLLVVEAEEIARVADEILAEGDAVLARDLLTEALALLAPERAAP